jgi:Protein of unknown function (DUF4240)
MNIDEFWNIVGSADKDTIIRRLSKLSQQDIIDFECLLRERIIECDNYDLIAALKIISGGVSDDSYLYLRCWLIGKGRRIFESALRQADSISDALGDAEVPDFEGLLYVATKAYEIKTGKKEDSTFPRSVCLARGLITTSMLLPPRAPISGTTSCQGDVRGCGKDSPPELGNTSRLIGSGTCDLRVLRA